MKLSFVITLLASMAILSLSAPVLSNDEAMLEALSATLEAETHNSAPAQADASVDVETSEKSTIAVRTITITSTRNNWMSFSWVACFDQTGKNVCAGKPATSNNAYAAPWGNPQTPLTSDRNTNTAAGNCFHSGSQDTNNWWKVDLQGDFDIASIQFGARNDGHQDQSSGLLITMQDKNGVTLPGAANQFTTTATQLQTFKVEGTLLGYKGNHDEHLAPVVGLLANLKTKLQNSIIASRNEVANKKATADAAKTAADQAAGVFNEASTVSGTLTTSANREIEMLDKIVEMVHTLNGKK